MNRIAEEVERDPTYARVVDARAPTGGDGPDAIAAAGAADRGARRPFRDRLLDQLRGHRAARRPRAAGIPLLSRSRPESRRVAGLALAWGVHSDFAENAHDLDDMVE